MARRKLLLSFILASLGIILVLTLFFLFPDWLAPGTVTISAYMPTPTEDIPEVIITPFALTPSAGMVAFTAPVWDTPTSNLSLSNAGKIIELARFGKGWPSAAAYSPDGALLAVGTSIGLEFKASATGRSVAVYPASSPILALAYSPDGKWIAVGRRDGQVMLIDGANEEVAIELFSHAKPVRGLAFSRPGEVGGQADLLASGAEDGSIVVWDIRESKARFQFSNPLFGYWGYGIRSLSFSPGNRILATGGDQGYVARWDLLTGKELPHLRSQSGLIFSIAFSPDGKRLASACGDGSVQLWDFASGKALFQLKGHTYGAWSVAYSGDGRTIATGDGDGKVRLWDALTGALRQENSVAFSKVDSLQFSPDGSRLAVVSIGEGIKIIDSISLADVENMDEYFVALRSAAFFPKGDLAVLAAENGVAYLWDLIQGKAVALGNIRPANKAGMVAVFSPNGGRLAVADGVQGVLRLYDTGNLSLVREEQVRGVRAVTYSADGAWMAAGGLDLIVFETASGKSQRISPLPSALTSLVFIRLPGSGGNYLAAGLESGAIAIWDLATGKSRDLSAGNSFSIGSLASHGTLLAAGDRQGGIQVWNMADGTKKMDFFGHAGSVFALAISPDGTLLVSGGMDGVIKTWDLANGRLLSVLSGHNGWINGLAFSPDGRLLLSVGSDGTGRIWGIRP